MKNRAKHVANMVLGLAVLTAQMYELYKKHEPEIKMILKEGKKIIKPFIDRCIETSKALEESSEEEENDDG